MEQFLIVFPDCNEEIKVNLLKDKAPKTCEKFLEAIDTNVETTGSHAIYTGREISVQLPFPRENDFGMSSIPKENLTCFPLPGDILFTYMPEYAFGGNPNAIYDIGLFYGRDSRTFFPMGWLPGNLFAQVADNSELQKLEKMGEKIRNGGNEKIIFKRS